MAVSVEYNTTLGIIESVFKGFIHGIDLQEGTSKAISMGKELGIRRFLCDAKEIELTASMIEVFNMPDKQYDQEKADRLGWLAVILPSREEYRDAVLFFETACQNRGWNVKTFLTRLDAIEWLNENTS